MKKTGKISSIILVILILVTACENEDILFTSSMNFISFSSSSLSIAEEGTGGSVEIYLAAPGGTEATTVTLTVSTEGIASPAVEGTDFTISSKEINVGVGTTEVPIVPIDNAVFTGDKSFYLVISSNSKGYDVANQATVLVTIVDNEHPLLNWIGTYDVAAASYGFPGDWDEAWTVTTSAVAGDITKLQLLGIAGGNQPIIATIDKNAMTITIAPGQIIGDAYGYGNIGVYKGNAAFQLFKDQDITGTIENNGTMSIDGWAHEIVDGDYAGYIWDVFNTTWTKQ